MNTQFIKKLIGNSREKALIECHHDSLPEENRPYVFYEKPTQTLQQKITELNNKGYGVFIALHKTDGRKRKTENIKQARAFVIDFDNEPLPDSFPVEPHAIIQRDKLHSHVYWFIDQSKKLKLSKWRAIQIILAEKFNGDKKVSLPTQIIRVPDTYNQKNGKKLFKVKSFDNTAIPIDVQEFLDAFDITAEQISEIEDVQKTKKVEFAHGLADYTDRERNLNAAKNELWGWPDIEAGERNTSLFRAAATCKDYGLSPEFAYELLSQFNSEKVVPSVSNHELRTCIQSGYRNSINPIGCKTPEAIFGEAQTVQNDPAKPDSELKWSSSWAFVSKLGAFVDIESGQVYERAEIDWLFARNMYNETGGQLGMPGTQSSVSTQLVLHDERIPIYEQPTYIPGAPIEVAGVRAKRLNLWRPTKLKQSKNKNASWINEFFTYIVDDAGERAHLINYLAYVAQNPGKKINFMLLLQGKQGIGKSFIGRLMSEIVGPHNTAIPTNTVLSEKFNGWQKQCQLIVINELMQPHRAEITNKLKEWITEPTLLIRDLRERPYEIPNHFNIIAFTNHEDSIFIDPDDRRILAIYSRAEPKGNEYWSNLWDNFNDRASEFYAYLMAHDTSEFIAGGHAPKTTGKETLIEMSMNDTDIEIKNAIEAGEGIFGKKDLFSQEDFDQIMSLITSPKATWRQITRAFARLGCLSLGQVRFSKNDRRRVWAIRNFDKWRHADPGDIQQHLQTHMDEADAENLFK